MTEIQFLIDLLLNEPMTKELSEKLLKRIGTLEMEKIGQPKLVPFDPGQLLLPILTPCPQPIVFNPPTIGCDHQYPNPWFGINPPTCMKCGQQAFPYFTVTCETKIE